MKQRREVIENVLNILNNPGKKCSPKRGAIGELVRILGINDNIVKGICKVLPLTLLRYRDLKSRQFVRNLIKALIEEHPEWTVKHLTAVLAEIGQQQRNLVAT